MRPGIEATALPSRTRAALGVGLTLLLVSCGGPGAFVCERDDQCTRQGTQGTCEAGLCAFPDPDCPSGKRYGELSGGRAGDCVPDGGTGTGSIGSSSDGGATGSSPATTGGDTLAVSADASVGDTSAGASTSGDTTGDIASSTGGSSDTGTAEELVHNYVFVTSNTVAVSAFGGLMGADARCNALAGAAGLPGQYVAWLSTTDVDAIDRLGDAQGWARVDGRAFVRSRDAIVQYEHLWPIRLDEQGADRDGASVVTATGEDGAYGGPSDCGEWTSATGMVTRGSSDGLGSAFTDTFDATCDVSTRTYCFGIDDAVDVPVVIPPASGRRGFVTSTTLAATAGLAAFDALCQADARAAGLPGRYAALVATTTAAATERFDLTGAPWSLPNDVPIVEDAADLAVVGANLVAPIWLGATGEYDGSGSVWQGSTAPTALATVGSSCGDWSVATGEARAGTPSRSANWWDNFGVDCSLMRRVLCLEL